MLRVAEDKSFIIGKTLGEWKDTSRGITQEVTKETFLLDFVVILKRMLQNYQKKA